MKLFFSAENSAFVSYKKLIDDINSVISYPRILNQDSYYNLFRDLLVSFLSGGNPIVVDSDLSDFEIKSLGFTKADFTERVSVSFSMIIDEYDLISRIRNSEKWELTLFTSGTTGKPKRITHNLRTLTKAVKISETNSDDVWGFAYNPTHIAGIQVFLQALLNLNYIVRLFMLPKDQILRAIQKHEITNISATPTFLRLLLDAKGEFLSVRRITSGGEKFDENLRLPLLKMFPNARILNVYASTEIGTLLAADGEVFTVNGQLRDYVKILDSELYVSGDFTGSSTDFILQEGWFQTGDRVEVVSDEPLKIKFIGRVNESINVGGNKVFPTEVEEYVNSFPGVRCSIVYGKKNSVVGNIVLCDIETDGTKLEEKQILDYLNTKLQTYKIPRIIKFVDKIDVTRTGKISRK